MIYRCFQFFARFLSKLDLGGCRIVDGKGAESPDVWSQPVYNIIGWL